MGKHIPDEINGYKRWFVDNAIQYSNTKIVYKNS